MCVYIRIYIYILLITTMITITSIVAIIDTMFILSFFSWLLCNFLKREIVYIFNHRLRHQHLDKWMNLISPAVLGKASFSHEKGAFWCHEKLCQEVLTFHNQNNHTISIKNCDHFTSCQGAFFFKNATFSSSTNTRFFTPSTVASGSSGPWGHRAAKSVTWQHA